jgi:hypothetical protein
MTKAQRTAFAELRALARPARFRVLADAEGFPVMPGRYGQVEFHDGGRLAGYTDRPRVFRRLWAIPGVRRWQTGTTEIRVLFPPEILDQVAQVLQLRHRRQGSPAAARRMRERALARTTSATPERT